MALYISKGTISEMSEVKSGTSQSGNQWQRMDLTLEMPGYQGTFFQQIFRVSGKAVDDVLLYNIGDKVEVTWSMYAREWNGRMYNNVDLVKISGTAAEKPAPSEPAPNNAHSAPATDNPNEDLPF